ncbi:MAG: hypothetical protein JO359_00465 [Candidatus Eremiobacteraeota bacterium]|nr:hypothetical protein [Candidatus Eremiobacteraeota bacterium]
MYAQTATRGSGEKLCVLTQADFKPFGTLVYSKPDVHADQNGTYCVYRGKSGATGGVELDVFYPAGSTPDEIKTTMANVLGSDPKATYEPEHLPGVDESLVSTNVPSPGYFPFAANAVRRGDLIFSISLPASPFSKNELLKLSEIVLSRIAK